MGQSADGNHTNHRRAGRVGSGGGGRWREAQPHPPPAALRAAGPLGVRGAMLPRLWAVQSALEPLGPGQPRRLCRLHWVQLAAARLLLLRILLLGSLQDSRRIAVPAAVRPTGRPPPAATLCVTAARECKPSPVNNRPGRPGCTCIVCGRRAGPHRSRRRSMERGVCSPARACVDQTHVAVRHANNPTGQGRNSSEDAVQGSLLCQFLGDSSPFLLEDVSPFP